MIYRYVNVYVYLHDIRVLWIYLYHTTSDTMIYYEIQSRSMDNSFPGASRGSRPSFEGAKSVPARRDRDWAKRRSACWEGEVHGEHSEDLESEDNFPIFIPYHPHSYGK